MSENLLKIKKVVQELRKEDTGLIIDEEKESYAYFRSVILIEEGGENVRIPVTGVRQLARIRALTVADLIEIFQVDLDREEIEAFHIGKLADLKGAEAALRKWLKSQTIKKGDQKGDKLSENQVRLLLHLLGTLSIKEKEFEQSETKLEFNLVLCQHKRPDGQPFFHFCLLRDGENLEGISFKQSFLIHSVGILFALLIAGIAPNVPLWLDIFFPAPILKFAYDLTLAYIVFIAAVLVMAFLPIGRQVDAIQAIKRANIYFPQFKRGDIWFTFPSGSKTPLSEYLEFAHLFQGILEAGVIHHEITNRYLYNEEKVKSQELSDELALTRTGKSAQESMKQKNKARKLATARYSKGWSISYWKIIGFFILLIIVYILFMILRAIISLDLGEPTEETALVFWGLLSVLL